jgi:hypothetical protein
MALRSRTTRRISTTITFLTTPIFPSSQAECGTEWRRGKPRRSSHLWGDQTPGSMAFLSGLLNRHGTTAWTKPYARRCGPKPNLPANGLGSGDGTRCCCYGCRGCCCCDWPAGSSWSRRRRDCSSCRPVSPGSSLIRPSAEARTLKKTLASFLVRSARQLRRVLKSGSS